MPHGHGPSASGRHLGALGAAFAITATFMVVELAAGLATSSLALLSGAAPMVTDVVGVGLGLLALLAARRATPGGRRRCGLYRGEVLAALANAVLLFGVAASVLVEAVLRFTDPPA